MKEKKQITDIGFHNLASAIIERACNDYVLAVKRIKEMQSKEWFEIMKRKRENKKIVLSEEYAKKRRVEIIDEAECEIRRIRKFFRSDWFSVLCDLDVDYLIDQLDKRAML